MRQYYDVLFAKNDEARKFIGTPAYEAHKKERFLAVDLEIPIAENMLFVE